MEELRQIYAMENWRAAKKETKTCDKCWESQATVISREEAKQDVQTDKEGNLKFSIHPW